MPKFGKLLSDPLKEKMLRQHCKVDNEPQKRGYGLGFQSEHIKNRHLNGHNGGMPGNTTFTLFDTNERIVVSILSNSLQNNLTNLQEGIWHILNKFESEYDSSSPLLKYEGKFYNIWNTYYFIPMGNKIYITTPTSIQPLEYCSEIKHLKGNTFEIMKDSGYGSYGQHVKFNMNKNMKLILMI